MNRMGTLFSRGRSLVRAAVLATATVCACGVLASSFAACSSEETDAPRLEGRYEAVLDPNLQFDNMWFSSDGRYHAWKAGCEGDSSCHDRGTFKLDVDAATLALASESGAPRTYALSAVPEAAEARPTSAQRSSGSVLTPRAEGGGSGAGALSCAPGDGTDGSKASGASMKSLRPLAEGSGLIGGGGGPLVGDSDSLISECVNLTVGKAGLLTNGGGLIVSLNISLIIGGGGRNSSDGKSEKEDKPAPPTGGSSTKDAGTGGGSPEAGSGGSLPGGSSPGGSSPGGSSPGGGSSNGGKDGGATSTKPPGGATPPKAPAPTPLKRTGANDSPTSTGYSRAEVHRIAKDHHKPGSGTADDILDPALTTQELVNAVGWLADNFKGDWGFSVINTGHHYDPRAHSGGFSIDIFANNPSGADDAAFMAVVNKDPYFVEIGVSGDYAGLQGAITDSKKCSFIENAPTHVHASVKRAFCG